MGNISVSRVVKSGNTLTITFSPPLAEYPLREESVSKAYEIVRASIPEQYRQMALKIETNRSQIEDLIPTS
ncbi:MAG: hypothetical protein QMB82_05850 [Bacteroidales bacterium]